VGILSVQFASEKARCQHYR